MYRVNQAKAGFCLYSIEFDKIVERNKDCRIIFVTEGLCLQVYIGICDENRIGTIIGLVAMGILLNGQTINQNGEKV